jgi:RNA polymerase-binding transcription factor DksA
MTESELEHIEDRLHQERDRATENLRRIEAEEETPLRESSGELSTVPSHMADGALQTQEQEKDFHLMTRESRLITLIDRALELLHHDPETFAHCEECGAEIEFARLDIVPWTRLCARSARAREAGDAPLRSRAGRAQEGGPSG